MEWTRILDYIAGPWTRSRFLSAENRILRG
jgi:hypothetical protein